MRKLLVMVALLGPACSRPQAELPRVFDAARNELRYGNLRTARAKAEEGIGLAGRLGDRLYQARFRLLRSQVLLSSREANTALQELQSPQPAGAEYRPLRARRKMLEAQALMVLGRSEQAAPVLEEALRLGRETGDQETVIEVETLNGARLLRLRQWEEAERILQTAVRQAEAARSPYLQAGLLLNLGMSRVARQRYDEAAGYFERASSVAGPKARTLVAAAQSNLAICYYRLGEFDRASAIQAEVIREYEKSGAGVFLQQTLGEAGTTFLLSGQPGKAIPYFERALALAKDLHRAGDAAIWAGNLSSTFGELADWDHAEQANAEAKRLKSGPGGGNLVYNQLNDARILLGRGRTAEAVLLYRKALAEGKENPAVLWEAHAGLGGAAARSGDLALADHHFEAAIRVVERTRSDLLRTEFKLPFLTRLIRLYQADVEILMRRNQPGRALAIADSSRGQVLAEGFGVAANGRTPIDRLVRLARAKKLVLVSYWLADPHSYVWVISSRGLYSRALAPQSEIEPLVRRYRAAVEKRLVDPLAANVPEGAALFRALVEPVLPRIPRDSRVVLIPDGVLHGLNLEMLPVPGAAPRYWIEQVTLSVAPSLALLVRPATHASARGMLLLGDPVSRDPTFLPLAQAGRELESIRARFSPSESVILRGEQATPEAFRRAAPGRFANIHFAAHATANYQSPLDSAVVLSGGKIYAREIMTLPLNAGLVTVSACRGVGVRAYSGEGLVGFAWAFLRAGARHVIAGLWDVNDASTALLMEQLYRSLAQGQTPAAALRSAKLAMLAGGGNFGKPYYWAPFQVYTSTP
ncbi:MAG: CHAT domain-containing protein [Acidobacteria bacterium]|nr:CHAT domain-containing protein [Acidobacteriota bacterium]